MRKKDTFTFDTPQDKARYVNSVFVRISDGYDRMNRMMSLGRDMAWRRRAIELAGVPPGGRLLDVATGTGDMALLSLAHDPSIRVTGVDFTPEMLQVGRAKENGQPGQVGWTNGDGLRLPFPDETFDAAISGFMMRNVTDVAAALAEQRRVVRTGGRVVCLEMTYPATPGWRALYRWFFNQVLPILPGFLTGQPDAYCYLPASLANFMSAEALKSVMETIGLRGVGYQRMMLGSVAVHVGVKS
jgi:demethylmenaquinone methyltransferase/2-methoxy-6-polyprenyl-1,4-benzoquinol methylase